MDKPRFVRWKLGYHGEPSTLQYGDGVRWDSMQAQGLEAGLTFCALREKGYQLVLDDRWHPVSARTPGPDRSVVARFENKSECRAFFKYEATLGWHWLILDESKDAWDLSEESPVEWAEENPWKNPTDNH